MSRIKQAWGAFWAGEGERRLLWLPVMLAAGMAAYYALPTEPSFAHLAFVVGVLGLLTFLTPRALRAYRLFIIAIFLIFLGMALACLHTLRQPNMVLKHELTPRPISGVLEDIERVENGLRFTLGDARIRGLAPEATPQRVRLSIRLRAGDATPLPRIGARVELMAGLLPPMGPTTPSGFDFARYFFFRDIGAIGYGLPPWKTVEDPASGSIATQFGQWRFNVTERIITALGPRHGPIAAGLITGEDRAISEQDFRDLRASNLYHIIAISGGHMVVIAGVIFFALRALFLLTPWGLRPQAKSVAAAITLVMVTLYLFVTGLPISAVRAYVMIALVLLAVILRREVDGMRSLLLAALIMLVLDPSDLLEPGFQLSFVATLAIVALAEARWLNSSAERPRWQLALRLMGAAILISIVAEGATSMLVLSMFNTIAPYGVPANALASLLVAFVIMPTVALFFVLLPFGLEGAALWMMDYGIAGMMLIARSISDLPGSLMFAPGPPGWGVALWVLGLLVFCMVRQRQRYVGVVLMTVAIASAFTTRVPDLIVGPELRQVAMRTEGGHALLRGRADSMVPELWANALGYERLPTLPRGDAQWRCDRVGCVATLQGKRIAMPLHAVAVAEDCARSDLVLTTLRVYRCKAPLIGPKALAQGGVHAFWMEEGTLRHETSADWQGQRPWSLH